MVIVYSFPIYQLFFYSILSVTFKSTNPPRKYFGFLLMTLTGLLLLSIVFFFGTGRLANAFYFALFFMLLSAISLFYIYIKALLKSNDSKSNIPTKIILLLPLIGTLLLFLLFLLHPLLTQGHIVMSYGLVDPATRNAYSVFIWVLQGSIFSFHFIFTNIQIVRLLQTKYSNDMTWLNLGWVYIILVSLMLFVLVTALKVFVFSGPSPVMAAIYNFLILLCGGLTGFFGLKQNDLFALVSGISSMGILKQNTTSKSVSDPGLRKSHDNPIADDEAEEIVAKITLLMNEKKPFLNKRFSLDELSKLLSVKRKHLSYVINHVMDINFLGLVNEYRIREAMIIMKNDTKNLTIDAISCEVGFHSRSSFYSCFKKYTGQTPVEYISSLNKYDEKKLSV